MDTLRVQAPGDGAVLVPDRAGRRLLRLPLFVAPAERRLRHPALGRDHHPADRGRGRDPAGADRGLVHPDASRRAVAGVVRPGRLAWRPSHRVRRAPGGGGALPAPGRGALRDGPRSGGSAREPARGPSPQQALRRAAGGARPVVRRRAGRDRGPDRAQRRRKDHRVRPGLRIPRPRRRRDHLPRPLDPRPSTPPGERARPGPHLSDHAALPPPERGPQRHDRHAGASPRSSGRPRPAPARCWSRSAWTRGPPWRPAR